MQVVIPEGFGPGEMLTVQTLDGHHVQVQIPPGSAAGSEIVVEVPPAQDKFPQPAQIPPVEQEGIMAAP